MNSPLSACSCSSTEASGTAAGSITGSADPVVVVVSLK